MITFLMCKGHSRPLDILSIHCGLESP